jgi:hypothetical protein
MATLNDQTTGVAAKISAAGSLLVSTGDDGLPTYFVPIYLPRVTTALSVNAVLWAIRAPATRTLVIQSGVVRLELDTAAASTEVGIDMVRFTGADPTGGTAWVPAKKSTTDPDALTTVVRSGSAIAGLTTTSMVIDAASVAFFRLQVHLNGGTSPLDMAPFVGTELAPGEGLAITTKPNALPIGAALSGYLQFSEKP